MSELVLFETELLGQLATIRRGITYSADMLVERDSGMSYINMKSFKKGGGFNIAGLKYFSGPYSADDLSKSQDLLIVNTDVTLDGDIVGLPAYLPDNIRRYPVLFSHHVTRLRLDFKINPEYLYHLLCLDNYRRWMLKYARGTTVLMLDMTALKKIPIRYPASKNLQQNIVEKIRTFDVAIEKTEALIEKYQKIKAGLMHDLLTRGITPDGKIRPSRAQSPELYWLTPIGWLPNEWTHDQLENLLAPVANNLRSGPFGSALLKSELVEEGIPFLGIDNIHVENFVDNFRRFVSENKFLELIKYSVRPRDVIITIMGTVGRCAVAPSNLDRALSSKHLWAMTLNQELVIPELVCWQLNYAAWVKSWFRRETQGGIMDAIQSKTLKKLRLPLPPIDEQKVIHQRYQAINEKIDCEKMNLDKLLNEKKGLMHDLLTGKVQVKVDASEEAHV